MISRVERNGLGGGGAHKKEEAHRREDVKKILGCSTIVARYLRRSMCLCCAFQNHFRKKQSS